MASEYIQDLAFRQVSKAIMATANSVASSASGGGDGEASVLDVLRRKWGKVQDVIQGIAAPLKRRSMYDELPEHVWPQEQIEMSQMIQRGRGHNFLPCQLSNPTWCDYCGDFIWGLYKQCLRCQICQYTCHQHCVPAVTLNCKSISDDGYEVHARTPSPSDPRSNLETSLSMGISARPGCARMVPSGSAMATNTTSTGQQRVSESVPDFQHLTPRKGRDSSPRGAVNVHRRSPSPRSSASPYLSRSVSEGFVTANSSPAPPSPYKSQKQHISNQTPTPSQCSHPSSDSPSGSLRRTHEQLSTSRLPQHVVSEDGCPQEEVIQGNNNSSSNIISDSNSNNLPQNAVDDVSDSPVVHRLEVEGNPEAATEKDETDSGYRSGTIPDDKLPRVPSQATLDRQELKRKAAKFNHFVPAASIEVTGKESFQGFVKVTMNLIRPITMELGARPPSIYELLTREHIVEENTQQVAFYMPRDTHKSLHITSDTTTKEVVTSLLKKFHILDHPRKFAMYEQEFNDKNKLVRLRRLNDKDFPLRALLTWDPERIRNYRMVLQENETGEIVWDAFSLPELGNFLKVLDREEKETILELKHKYAYMKQYMERRMAELRNERNKKAQLKN